jgi:hypothetical protein
MDVCALLCAERAEASRAPPRLTNRSRGRTTERVAGRAGCRNAFRTSVSRN